MHKPDASMQEAAYPEQNWLDRQSQLFASIDEELDWYFSQLKINGILNQTTKFVVLLCAVLAPVTVASSVGQGLSVFGLSAGTMARISVAVTLILAFAEGLRRTFAYEERWATCYVSTEALTRLREDYRDRQVGKAVGDDDWVKNFVSFRRAVGGLMKTDTQHLIGLLRQGTLKSPPP